MSADGHETNTVETEGAEDEALMAIFMEVQRGLPRQGLGDNNSTRQALSFCQGLSDEPAVLDIGCGPGMQTLVLAENLDGPITAVDLYQEYLDELAKRAEAIGMNNRITTVHADMSDLPFPP